ncbi:hypothetical protein [Paenibacillus montanisoli]|uniref:Uncharacterized protein n=1 Tax=Paenibacillus montanisoli TaxID=2081970 RepID=A0A328TVJ3_9BACL|nr:hypothetical protein [Paenibacillus montanisoli]RAP73652.1 hypothetical protein DL346_25635 [Paenibacillus montanisoli]
MNVMIWNPEDAEVTMMILIRGDAWNAPACRNDKNSWPYEIEHQLAQCYDSIRLFGNKLNRGG